MSFKEKWKKFKYWQKGGIIGAGILTLGILSLFLTANGIPLARKLFMLIYAIPLRLDRLIFPDDRLVYGQPSVMIIHFATMLVFLLLYPLIGIIIGFLIDKITKK